MQKITNWILSMILASFSLGWPGSNLFAKGPEEAHSKPYAFTGIEIFEVTGQKRVVSGQELQTMALDLKEDQKSFPEQVVIPVNVLLERVNITAGKTIEFSGEGHQTLRFPFAEVKDNRKSLALINTHSRGWKLVHWSGEKNISKTGNFYLRSLKKITLLGSSTKTESGNLTQTGCSNTRVYVDLERALSEPKGVCIVNLGGQKLKKLPQEIFQLTNLKELYLGRNNIKNLPPEIGGFHQLRTLTLGRNRLKTLPPEIGDLKNLQILKLGRNRISSLPKEIGHLNRLRKLELDNNQVKILPPEVGQLENLRELELANNPIQELPDSLLQLRNLEKIELSGKAFSPEEKIALIEKFKGVEIEWE